MYARVYTLLCRSIRSKWTCHTLSGSRKYLSDAKNELVSSRYSQLINKAKREGRQLNNKEKFANALKDYLVREKFRRGHVNFIAIALHRMEEFSVEKDLESYNMLLNVFPKNKFHGRNRFERLWPKPSPQIELALHILVKMEDNGIIPDVETYDILAEVFGVISPPITKCLQMVKWFDRYAEVDPYEILGDLPTNPVDLSKIVLKRIAGKSGVLDRIQVLTLDNGHNYSRFNNSHRLAIVTPQFKDFVSPHDSSNKHNGHALGVFTVKFTMKKVLNFWAFYGSRAIVL